MEKSIDGLMIKEFCIKLTVDRLGNIFLAKNNENSRPPTQNNSIVSEPDTIYNKKPINTSTSFEDMENDQLTYFASLTPEVLLKNLRNLLKLSFGIKDESVWENMPRIINLNPKP